jgi:hypothetical protein
MGEQTPVTHHDDLNKPGSGSPRVVRDRCWSCGRSPTEWLTWREAYDRYGTARASCMRCLRTDIPFVATFL